MIFRRTTREPFLATPKGIFLVGFALGAMTILSLAFMHVMSGGRAPAEEMIPAPIVYKDVPPVGEDDHVRGTGRVTVIVYSDFECPYCRSFHPTMRQIMKDNPDAVRWVLRHLPLSSVHPHAQKLAEASECAAEQGRFWEMADAIFDSADAVSAGRAAAYAKTAGVDDLAAFQECLDAGTYAEKVRAQADDALAAGAEGTPFSLILAPGGRTSLIPGALPIESVQALIDGAQR